MSKCFSMLPTISKHSHLQLLVDSQQMEAMKSWQNEAFEKLGPCKDFPITHYFDSHAQYFAQISAKPSEKNHHGKDGNGDHKEGREKQNQVDMISEKKKEPETHLKGPQSVDEDLYKIPPELLHKKPKHKRLQQLSSWLGCLGMSCIPCCP